MREILFKGKRKDNGEWAFGEYITIYDDPKYKAIKTCIELNTGVYEVDPDTVCQYTGLTDRNGTKIYENDIVKYDDALHKVVFENRFGNAYFGIVMNDRNEVWNFSPLVPADKMFVVGNIFDNPELIGGVEK